jgi:putative FmdB family regulatory protein
MPLYLFRCSSCHEETEQLLPLGEIADRDCEHCGGTARLRFGRVAVKYNSWGFTATDRLSARPGGTEFTALREKAEQISDE